jgi:acetylornithine deacetylase/succinyl-diaminopimelate desuccinylase-like protein
MTGIDDIMRTSIGSALLLLAVAFAPVRGQQAAVTCNEREVPACADVRRMLERTDVQRAMRFIEEDDARTIADLIRLTQIPAPPFGEEARARAFADLLRDAGADSVWTDEEGNVLALRRGRTRERTLAIAGHLDTVFPEGTDVTVRERGDTLFAPGIADDTRGLTVLLAILRALETADLQVDADVLFIGTVGEEGLGDLRGVKHLFRQGGPRIDAMIAIDGGSDSRIVNQALGSRRYRVTFEGPGGHSWGAFGTANPVHALGRAIHFFDQAADPFTSTGARTSYNVGRIGGGTSVNAVAFEAWLEVDMRSESRDRLAAIDSIFRAAVDRALREQNELLRRGDQLTVNVELVGDRPSGGIDPGTPLVQRAIAATRAIGMEPELQRSSTDSNIPISLGIPAVTIGRGGVEGQTHSPGEWWINRNGPVGIHRALLLLLVEAGMTRPTSAP